MFHRLPCRRLKNIQLKLAALRKSQGITYRALSEATGISHGNLSDYLNNRRPLTLEVAQAIANAMGYRVVVRLEKKE